MKDTLKFKYFIVYTTEHREEYALVKSSNLSILADIFCDVKHFADTINLYPNKSCSLTLERRPDSDVQLLPEYTKEEQLFVNYLSLILNKFKSIVESKYV